MYAKCDVASGAGHAGTLLLEASTVGVEGADDLVNGAAISRDGVGVAGQVDAAARALSPPAEGGHAVGAVLLAGAVDTQDKVCTSAVTALGTVTAGVRGGTV